MRALALVLILAAVGAFAVSFTSRYPDTDAGWTMYTPLSNEAPIDEYDGMAWDDARLWLGLAIGFGVSAAGVGVVSLRRRD